MVMPLTSLISMANPFVVEISCVEVWQEISNYVDGDVEPEMKSRMEAHLRKCKHCVAVLEGTRNTVQLLADGEWFPLPTNFSERLLRRLSSEFCEDK